MAARPPPSPSAAAVSWRYPDPVNSDTMEIEIRPVHPAEYEALGALTLRAYHALEDYPQRDPYDASLMDVKTRAESSRVVVAVARDGSLLGGVTYVSGPEDPFAEELLDGDASIRMLAVDPARQGAGVGRALTQWCLDKARQTGRRRMILHTSFRMPRAIRMYERMGFVRTPELDYSPVPGVNLLGFAFDLRRDRSTA